MAVEKARTVQELKEIRDQAEAVRQYAKQRGESTSIIFEASEIKVRAEWRAGKLLREDPDLGPGKGKGYIVKPLEKYGVDKSESHRWQRLAELTEKELESWIASKRKLFEDGELPERDVPTSTEGRRKAKTKQRKKKEKENQEKVAAAESPELLTGTFSTIVIDPPWDYTEEGDVDVYGRTKPTYKLMSIEEIGQLPVGSLAADEAHLYLWITNRSMPKGFGLLDSWGFRFITILTWCKPSIGVGNYFRNNTEHILFGVKGSLPLNRKDVGTWFEAKRGPKGHSSKPKESYELIESCSPGPYLEMFSRLKRDGWASWGAEA